MPFIETGSLRYFQFKSFQDMPIFHAIITRQGGVSQGPFESLNTGGTVGDDPRAVMENHRRIYQTFGYAFDSRFDVWQVHGNEILIADSPRPPEMPHPKADGILTDNTQVTLFMRFADCVPVLLADPAKNVIGIVHAGWQGTYKKVVQKAVERMCAHFGSKLEDIRSGIGPSICQNCYEVGQEVQEIFKSHLGERAKGYFARHGGHLYLDLWRANYDALREAGLSQIEVSEICTSCNLSDWFSHRAEGGKTGRFAVLMALKHNEV